jgi:hypothetical protein
MALWLQCCMSLQISSLWTEHIGKLHERLASILTGRTSDSLLMTQISSVTKTVTHLLEEGQRTMSPSFSNLQVQYFQFVQLYLNALYCFTLMLSTNEVMSSISFSEHDCQSSVSDSRFHIPMNWLLLKLCFQHQRLMSKSYQDVCLGTRTHELTTV